jgi:hypothetical protein
MINKHNTNNEVEVMSRSKVNTDVWDQIFADLVLEAEPPIRYIKDAIIVTKNGSRFKVSPDDFADIVARERSIDPEQSDIISCSLTINFSKVKRDVNKWTHSLLDTIETEAAEKTVKNARRSKSKTTRKKVD